MILTNDVVVEAPIDRVWLLVDEVETVIACMPGAAYIGCEGDNHKATMKVKVGAITANFQGTFRFLEKNADQRTLKIRGAGKDIRGKASATATVSLKLEPLSSARTKALVETDLALTGPLAQFGGGVMADIAARMIEQFTQNLHAAVIARSAEGGGETPARREASVQTVSAGAKAPAEPAAFDVGGILGKRALKYGALLAGFIAVGWLLGRLL